MKKFSYILAMFFAIIVLYAGIRELYDRWQLSMDEARTIGTVIIAEYDSATDSCVSVIEYYTEDSKRYELISSAGYQLYEEVEVRYQRSYPKNAFTNDIYGSLLMTILKIVMGIWITCTIGKELVLCMRRYIE